MDRDLVSLAPGILVENYLQRYILGAAPRRRPRSNDA
jgi:hypothetical protein